MKELNGKAKELFEEWYNNTHMKEIMPLNVSDIDDIVKLPLNAQWGYVQSFADSLGYGIWVHPCACHKPSLYEWSIINNELELYKYKGDFKTRNEARIVCIKALNELLNQ